MTANSEVQIKTKDTYPSGRTSWLMLAVLVLAYTVSYIDRTILTLLVEPIRADFQISDIQISLLHGFAFAIFYTFLGIPIARMADRFDRTKIIAAGSVVWSFMTALCGITHTFRQMFFARIGVGIGEAALSPAAFSILSDSFPPHRLALAMSVYATGVYMGGGIAIIAGGAIIAWVPPLDLPVFGHLEPWRVVFLAVSLPGIAVSVLMLSMREPKRRGLLLSENHGLNFPVPVVVKYIVERRAAYGYLIAGFSVHSLMLNGVFAWTPTFFMRTYHWDAATVGVGFGATLMTFGTIGILSGGWASGWLRRRGRLDANLILGITSSLAVLPFGIIAPLMPEGGMALIALCGFIFFGSFPYGGAAAACQEITPNQMRAQITAVFFFILNLAGIGVGPTLVALFTDAVFDNDLAVRYSMVVTILLAAPMSTLLLWHGLRPYRICLNETTF